MKSHEAVNEVLLSAYLDGEVTTAECAQVEQLLRDNDQYQQAFDEMKLLRLGMQQLPNHQLGEGFARSVLEMAEQCQPLPDEERVDLAQDQETVTSGSKRAFFKAHWQSLSLGLATVAAVLVAVLLMLPETTDDQNSPIGSTGDNPNPAVRPNDNTKSADVDQKNSGQGSDSNSDSANPENQEKLVGTGDSNTKSTTDAGSNKPVPVVNNPVVSKPIPEKPGIEQLATTRLLFVVEVAMTPAGIKNRRMDQILMDHGILYDRAIEVDRGLEQSILKSRYLKGVVAKRDNKSDDYMNVDLIYVVCNGQQVDDTTSALSGFPKDIAGHRYNLAMLPNELRTFKSLHEAVATQWKKKAATDEKVTEFKARAGRLLTDLVLLSRIARPLGTTSLLKVDPVPLPDKPAVLPPPRQPALIAGADGAALQCEVLFVVRHLPAIAERKELPSK